MLLKLYMVSDGDNVINKTKLSELSVNIKLRKDFDLQNPTFLINITTLGVTDYNYCELPELERFYFINNMSAVNNSIVKLECSTDLLETYKTDILSSNSRFYRGIETGDYAEITVNRGVDKNIITHSSDVDVTEQHSMILTTIGAGAKWVYLK